MRKIYAIGETTYDIIFRNNQPNGGGVGGSALNTAVSLGRLGLPVHFVSRFGNDYIGDLSAGFLTDNGVDCRYITRFDGQSRIALAFLDANNNASYQFYHSNQSPALTFPMSTGEDIITYGSLNALSDDGRSELLGFMEQAKQQKALIIYDPNIRRFAESERAVILSKVEENIACSTVVKGSTEDFVRLYGTSDPEWLFARFMRLGAKALLVTDGEKPATFISEQITLNCLPKKVEAISTIGAGDNFTAGVIYGLWKHHISSENAESTDRELWKQIVGYGNRFAAEVCQSESNYISVGFAQKFQD